MEYRTLTALERKELERRGCTAERWDLVQVAEPFLPERLRNLHLSGPIRIGRQERSVRLPGGVEVPCGLFDSRLHDCTFGDNVLISDVRHLANYDLEEGVLLHNVGSLATEGESAFGNGTRINILNEAGGRSLPLFDRLSAQIAYLLVLHRHNPEMIRALESLIDRYVQGKRSRRGIVKRNSRLTNCSVLRNVALGPHVEVDGALFLDEGTVVGCAEDSSFVGAGVIARHFIILSGSRVEGASMLESCFVGQGVRIGRQFSAEHSAFFANCECDHGEVVSLLAGPYTVSHHKSTLLIAGFVSFINVGSGTNQSNHMYRLGPLHQGILDRGVKTGSDSYLLWPSRVGAFTSVIGKHHGNFDTSEFPFSFISEQGGKSVLTPAVNLLSAGTRRDVQKWTERDRRRDPDRLDLITHGLLTPYTVGKILRGMGILRTLQERAAPETELILHGGVYVRRTLLGMCSRYYEMAVSIFLGSSLRARLAKLACGAAAGELRDALLPRSRGGQSEWWDLCGLMAPSSSIEELEADLSAGRVDSFEGLSRRFRRIQEENSEDAWAWALKLLKERLNTPVEKMSPDHLIRVLREWSQNAVKLSHMVLTDARKEFDERSRIGFGIDGGPAERDQDFRAVRGEFEDNSFVRQLQEESHRVEEEASTLIAVLESLSSP